MRIERTLQIGEWEIEINPRASIDWNKELEENECKRFHSILGSLIYISQDKLDS